MNFHLNCYGAARILATNQFTLHGPLWLQMELRLQLPEHYSPFQLEQLLHQSRLLLEDSDRLDGLKPESSLVSLDNDSDDCKTLIVFVLVELHGWPAYLHMRETILVQLEELLERIDLYEITIGVSYATTSEIGNISTRPAKSFLRFCLSLSAD